MFESRGALLTIPVVFLFVIGVSGIVSQGTGTYRDPRHDIKPTIGGGVWNQENCSLANAPPNPTRDISKKIIRCEWSKRNDGE